MFSGMELRCVNGYEVVEAGDTGVFKQWNDGTPPVQVDWRNYGSKYWVYWRDVEIIDKEEVEVPLEPSPDTEREEEEEGAPTQIAEQATSVLSGFTACGGVEALVTLAQRVNATGNCRQWLQELTHCLALPAFQNYFIHSSKNRRLLFDALEGATQEHTESDYFASYSSALVRLFKAANSHELLCSALHLIETLLLRLSLLTHEEPRGMHEAHARGMHEAEPAESRAEAPAAESRAEAPADAEAEAAAAGLEVDAEAVVEELIAEIEGGASLFPKERSQGKEKEKPSSFGTKGKGYGYDDAEARSKSQNCLHDTLSTINVADSCSGPCRWAHRGTQRRT